MLDKHGFNLRQALQVAQPQWHLNSISQGIEALSFHERGRGSLERMISLAMMILVDF